MNIKVALVATLIFICCWLPVNAQEINMTLEIKDIGLYEEVVPKGTVPMLIDGYWYDVPVTPDLNVAWFNESALPDGGDNIVMYGHDLGVFMNLHFVEIGNLITVYLDEVPYYYVISKIMIVPDAGISYEERVELGRLILPQGREMVTLVTCYGFNLSSRLIVIGERTNESGISHSAVIDSGAGLLPWYAPTFRLLE